MTLWILKPKEGLIKGDNPWDPWYDKCFGFIVRADSEGHARALADDWAKDENRAEFLGEVISTTEHPWLSPDHSTCEPLDIKGDAGVVMMDVHSA